MTDKSIAYVTAHYPAISHTFVQREVKVLRDLGVDIQTYSIHRTEKADLLSADDEESFRTTEAILPISKLRLLGAHLGAFVRSPGAYVSTLKYATSRGTSLRGRIWQMFYFAEAVVMHASCKKRGIRHVHAHLANVAADVARLVAHFGNKHGQEWSWSFTMHGPTEFFDVQKFGLRDKVRDADFVICISSFCRSQLVAVGGEDQGDKFAIVHCGVDTSRFALRDTRPQQMTQRILCVGRLVPEKGQADLIRALARLRENGSDVQLTLVGRGESEARLRELAQQIGLTDAVEFAGAVGQDEIRSYYEACDVFCLPSAAEGVPVVLMEAMAMGIPVVSTRITGIPELIEDGKSGLLITPSSIEELTDALRVVLGDPEYGSRLGKEARERVIDEFDIEHCGEQLRDEFARRL